MFKKMSNEELAKGLKEVISVYNLLQNGLGKELNGYEKQIELTEVLISTLHEELLSRGVDITN